METKAIIYIPTITSIEKYLSVARKAGFKAEGIWSIHNSDHPLTEKQHEIRLYLIENQAIPDDIDILFINKSYETSINIFSPLDIMIIHTTNSDTIIQVRGRYRSDLKNLFCLNQSEAEIEVPQEFLNRPLFKEDKDMLCNQLSIRDNGRRIVGWTTVKKKLIENGYYIRQKKTQGRRVDIITTGLY